MELKLKNLEEIISKFETKWKVNFEAFKKKTKEGVFGKDAYSFSVEQDFWQWEEAETLKKHYGFLHFFETGVGDYTREREKWLGEPSVRDIAEEIKEQRKGK